MSILNAYSRQLRLVLAICLIYLLAWLSYYSQITLGQYSSPETNEAIAAAFSQTSGQPFSLYQRILATIARFTESKQELISIARALNAIAFFIAIAVSASAAGHFWKSHRAACATGLLMGLYPVLLFRVGELSPTVFATACMAVALSLLLRWVRNPSLTASLFAGGALALGASLETALIGPALVWPIAALLYPKRKRIAHLAFAAAAPALLFALLSVSDLQLQEALHFDLSQIGAKTYTFFNNNEAYDGLSYHIHKRLHLLLFLNPLHWGILFTLAAGGAYARVKDGHRGRSLFLCALLLLSIGLLYIFNDGASRTRLVLIPLLAIFAGGGIAFIPKIWHHAGTATRRNIAIGTFACAALTYSTFFDVNSTEDWEKDYSFMAHASIALGKSDTAILWANKTLDMNPGRKDMHSVLVQAHFNEWATISKPKPLSVESAKALLAKTEPADMDNPIAASIQAIYRWKLRDQQAATAIWQTYASESALAQMCLLWTAQLADMDPPASDEEDPYHALLQTAREINRSSLSYGKNEKLIDNILANAH